jgi:hypothetical protein
MTDGLLNFDIGIGMGIAALVKFVFPATTV